MSKVGFEVLLFSDGVEAHSNLEASTKEREEQQHAQMTAVAWHDTLSITFARKLAV